MEQYEGKTAVGLSEAVKSQHVLPFIPGIVALAARMESLLPALAAHGVPRFCALALRLVALHCIVKGRKHRWPSGLREAARVLHP